jgi:hypothetical protein
MKGQEYYKWRSGMLRSQRTVVLSVIAVAVMAAGLAGQASAARK